MAAYDSGVDRQDGTGSAQSAGRVAAVVAGLQALGLIGNAAVVAVVAIRDGITGPSAVASPAGVVTEVVVFALFGAALAWVAWGLWTDHAAARTPFLLAQILTLTVGVPMLSSEAPVNLVGVAVTASAVVGLLAWLGAVVLNKPQGQADPAGG